MIQLPPIPTWDALHPLIIHFPIALLFIAPLCIVLGAAMKPDKGRSYLIAALVLMLVGTLTTFVAAQTGEAAGKLTERTPQINAVLEHHERLAEATQVSFSVLSAIFAAIVFVPRLMRRESTRMIATVLPLVYTAWNSSPIGPRTTATFARKVSSSPMWGSTHATGHTCTPRRRNAVVIVRRRRSAREERLESCRSISTKGHGSAPASGPKHLSSASHGAPGRR